LKGQLAEPDSEKRRRDEDERRRQEAETKRRVDEAEAEERRRAEEVRRLNFATVNFASLEAQRGTQAEPQQQVKPWLLPVIGAGAASLLTLPIVAWIASTDGPFAFVVVMIYALYGGVAGMLVQRFSIPKAVTIPIIPAVLLLLVVPAFSSKDPQAMRVGS